MALLPAFTNHFEMRAAEFTSQFALIWGTMAIAIRFITKDKVVLID